MPETLSLFPELALQADRLPAGFQYTEALVSEAEQQALIRVFETLTFAPCDFRGFKGHRQTVAFGSRYDFTRSAVAGASPIPEWLQSLKAKAAAFAGLADSDLVQALISEYRPGAGIGWHRDRPEYGRVVGVSFASQCILRLRRREGTAWVRRAAPLAPGSAYCLDGEVRDLWQHSIVPAEALRYSVTFRTLR
jgi:alkylated DNA repair protein (DNA oxidative demethylase)